MSERVQQLLDMNTKKSVMKFNGNKFRDYVKSTPRNYSVVVMFTAMAPARQCMICRHASDEFTIVANSYRYSQLFSSKLFFAMVDFDEGSDVFQMVYLRILNKYMLLNISSKIIIIVAEIEYGPSVHPFSTERQTKAK